MLFRSLVGFPVAEAGKPVGLICISPALAAKIYGPGVTCTIGNCPDPAANHNDDLAKTFEDATAKFCVMSFTTDWRFSPARSRELVDALMAARKDVCYLEIDAPQGHDAFLIPIPRYLQAFGNYMNRITV